MRFVVTGLSALALAGCSEPVSGPTSSATTAVETAPSATRVSTDTTSDYAYEAALPYAQAKIIAKYCPGISFRKIEGGRTFKPLMQRLRLDGYADAHVLQFRKILPPERFKKDMIAYYEKRNIVPGNSESFCAAGRLEIAEGTDIGRYLRG